MRTALCWIGGAIFLSIVLYLVTPQDKLDRGHESWLRLTGSPDIACLDYERRRLKDPDSAKLISAISEHGTTTIRYRATNSYGAFISAEAQCATEDGKVNLERTQVVRENTRLEDRIGEATRQLECSTRLNILVRKGTEYESAISETRRTEGCGDFKATLR